MRTPAVATFLFVFVVLQQSANSQAAVQAADSLKPNTLNPDRPKPDTLNPNAPPQLSYFAFLVGNWKCDVLVKQPDGTPVHLDADWRGHYILDGYAIADQFSMRDPQGELITSGMNFRSFNVREHAWNMKWFEGISSVWQDIGEVEILDSSITYRIQVSASAIHRIKYYHISNTHFDWSADISKDNGKTWEESVMTISADRKL